jgi:hypothetical protein
MNRIINRDGTWHRRNGLTGSAALGSGVGALPWKPTDVTSLVCWYDADDPSTITIDTRVSEWRDKSGNNNNTTQTNLNIRPEYLTNDFNGRSVINFRGADRLDHTYAQSATDISIFAVCNMENELLARFLYSTTGNTTTQTCLFTRGDGASGTTNAFGAYGVFGGGTTYRFATSVIMDMGWNIIGVTRTTSGQFYLNGSTDGTFGTGSQGFSAGFIGGPTVGNSIKGKVGEIVVFNASIDTFARQKLEGYLAHKWGLTRLLPATHPWKYIVPQK